MGTLTDYKTIDFQLLFESVPHLYLVLDTDFRIIGVSNAYLKATMVTRNQILGRGIFDVFPDNPEDPNATGVKNLHASLSRVLKNKCSDTMAIQKYDILSPATGKFEERYWSPNNCPVIINNAIKYIIHSVEDVTDLIQLKKSDAEQQALMQKLRTRTGEMEVEIYQRAQEIQRVNYQLEKANKDLAKINQLKTQFFTNLSHELRTPLMLILGPLERFLMNEKLNDSELKAVRLMQNNAKILLKHVKDLLDIAKLEAGKMAISYVNADLVEIIQTTLALFEERINDKKIQLLLALPEKLVVQLDVEKIQRVLMNLLSNALKFTPDRGFIKLTLNQVEDRAQIILEDNGSGIPEELCESIFDPFFQVEESTTRQFQGTGLGLAITKDFVELHKGKIKASNSLEGGAVFTIDIPLQAPPDLVVNKTSSHLPSVDAEIRQQVVEELKPRPRQLIAPQNLEPGNTHLPLVLVVEDDVDMNQFICVVLMENYRIENAFDGVEGFEKALKLHPDLIVSDIMMPQMNGIQMVHKIRQYRELLTTPIIILTAKVEEALCVQMLREGAQDYLAKPFSAAELLARVANLMLAKKAEDELERFVYLTSHDLKAPLPAINNLISWIQEDIAEKLPEQSKRHFYLLQQRALRMSNLLDGLLTYYQAGHVDLEISLVDTKKLVEQIINTLNPHSTFIFQWGNNLPVFETYKNQLKQVFFALIENSIKHHHQDNGHVEIGVNDAGNFYQFYVTDDGPGIESVYHSKIFQIFQTLKPRDVMENNGLGLSIAKKLVEKHGGKIEVFSEKNKGSTFYFTWPHTNTRRV